MRLLLASKSPRRAALLEAAGIAFEVVDVGEVDEVPPQGPTGEPPAPADVVASLARRKAEAGRAYARDALVLAADTLVFLDGEILGKPTDRRDAQRALRRLSGRSHDVATGVALIGPDSAGGVVCRSASRVTRVRFRSLSAEEIAAYVETGEPLDKAGSYALQGGAAGFVTHLEGDRDTVIGLPVGLVRELIGLWTAFPGDKAGPTLSR